MSSNSTITKVHIVESYNSKGVSYFRANHGIIIHNLVLILYNGVRVTTARERATSRLFMI